MNNHLQRLNNLLEHMSDPMELDNIQRDLNNLCLRIESQEYKNTDFLNRQEFDTLRRTHEYFNYLLGYHQQSLHWKEILTSIPLHKIKITFDFCPGSAPKVQWALQHLDYQGELTVFDKDPIACQQMKLLLAILNIRYPIYFTENDIYHPFTTHADLITANHILDDIVLDDYCKRNNMALRTLYSCEKDFRHAIENIIIENPSQRLCEKIFHAIHHKLNHDGYFILTHYPGLTERALNLLTWSDWVMDLLKKISEKFIEENYISLFKNIQKQQISYFITQKK